MSIHIYAKEHIPQKKEARCINAIEKVFTKQEKRLIFIQYIRRMFV